MGSSRPVRTVVLSRGGRVLAAGSDSGELTFFALPSGKRTASFVLAGSVRSVAMSPDGKLVAAAGLFTGIHLYRVRSSIKPWKVIPSEAGTLALSFDPGGRLLAAGGRYFDVKILEISTGKTRARLSGHTGWVSSVLFGSRVNRVYSAGWDGTIRAWDLDKRSQVWVTHASKYAMNALVLTRKSAHLLGGGDDRRLHVLRPSDGKVLASSRSGSITGLIETKGMVAVSTWQGRIRFFPPNGARLIRTLRVGSGPIHGLASNARSSVLAACCHDGKVKIILLGQRTGKSL